MGLTFRTKGLPKRLVRRILLLVAVFFGCLFLSYFLINLRFEEKTTRAGAPTLPVVTLSTGGRDLRSLHAYTAEMDACYMRDAVVPLDSTRVVTIRIRTYGNSIDGLSYQIRSLDTERKIAETFIDDIPAEDSGVITVSPELENLMEDGQEYLFVLTMNADERPLYFYTRVLMPKNVDVPATLDFCRSFHDIAFSGNSEGVAQYVEPSIDAEILDTTGLSEVTIHSTAAEVAWNGFTGTESGVIDVEWNEISSDYCALTLYYEVENNERVFDVSEYFKVRQGPERIYLLDYERLMTERFVPDQSRVSENTLLLGIISGDYHYRSNENGRIVAFVQDGELFEYNVDTRVFTTLFSFTPKGMKPDERTLLNDHAIRILSIDETGTVDFVVYGYMDSGTHEGQCGTNVMRYDSTTGNVSEQTFIKSRKSFQILNANFSELIYKSSSGDFYITTDGSLVHVDLNTLETETIASGLSEDDYAVSESRRYVALAGGIAGGEEGEIVIMDLETGTSSTVSPVEGEILRPVAFMDDDLVYGRAAVGDIYESADGETVYPMYELNIITVGTANRETLLVYQKPGIYVTSVSQSETSLSLTRVSKNADGTFTGTTSDTIRNSEGEINRAVSLTWSRSDGYGLVATLKMASTNNADRTAISVVRPDLVLLGKDEIIDIEVEDAPEQYFVYVGSRVRLASADVTEAIRTADAEMGIVIDNRQNYIWKRGKKGYADISRQLQPSDNETSRARCLATILALENVRIDVDALLSNGSSVYDIMTSALPDCFVLNLTDCDLSESLWYVSQGKPVYALEGPDSAVIISGYDASNVIIYDPLTDDTHKVGIEDATAAFATAGNTFISYLEQK